MGQSWRVGQIPGYAAVSASQCSCSTTIAGVLNHVNCFPAPRTLKEDEVVPNTPTRHFDMSQQEKHRFIYRDPVFCILAGNTFLFNVISHT